MTKTVEFKKGAIVKTAGPVSNTLVSALVGISALKGYKKQIEKIHAIAKLPSFQSPDIITDLSLIKIKENPIYSFILRTYPEFIVSTLPIYLCNIKNASVDHNELLDIIHHQAESGISMITIHPTPNKKLIRMAQGRLVPWTSRGGGIVINDLIQRKFSVDNAYLRIIDDIIKIANKFKLVISIGASFRSANIFDSYDSTQAEEFLVQRNVADYLSDRGIQVIIEGPGHSSPQKIKQISKEYLNMGYPIMPLGPIPTDIAIGQDHLSSSIGAVLLGLEGTADIITAVTREEHTGRVPSTSSTIEAIISAKIAAHIIDINKLRDFARDSEVVKYRAEHRTCVYGKKAPGCDRCLEACPLKIELN